MGFHQLDVCRPSGSDYFAGKLPRVAAGPLKAFDRLSGRLLKQTPGDLVDSEGPLPFPLFPIFLLLLGQE